jgi:hypothetical protein
MRRRMPFVILPFVAICAAGTPDAQIGQPITSFISRSTPCVLLELP